MKSSTLYKKMKNAGYGYRACASAVNAMFGGISSVHFYDIYKFVQKDFSRIGKERKRMIRQFFIAKGWMSAPAPRKAPTCRRCGCEYPTRRKLLKRNSPRNHKPTTKY